MLVRPDIPHHFRAIRVVPLGDIRMIVLKGQTMDIDRDKFNALRASRKADRQQIVDALLASCAKHGAKVEQRDEPRNPGYSGAGIDLRIDCQGVGAMIDIDDLHGGEWALIHWFNTVHPSRNFTARFRTCVGDYGQTRPHHKSTSQPRDWYSLAMMLDAGLLLAVRGEAFDEASAT
jgi:hypothetical protein